MKHKIFYYFFLDELFIFFDFYLMKTVYTNLHDLSDFSYSCNGSCLQLEQYAKRTIEVLLSAPSHNLAHSTVNEEFSCDKDLCIVQYQC